MSLGKIDEPIRTSSTQPQPSSSGISTSSVSPSHFKKYPFWLGGLSASLAAICTHPLDVAKVRMQTGVPRSMFQTLIEAIRTEGIRRGAYVGLSASLSRQMTYSLTRFGVYDSIKNSLVESSGKADSNQLNGLQITLAASLAGAAGGIAGNPADVILVRMTGDVNNPMEKRKCYKNCFNALGRMIREEGFQSLTRGMVPNVSRAILMNASQLATYDSIKNRLLSTRFFKEGLFLHFCASSMAGAIATTICSPFDVIKSRVMNSTGNDDTVVRVIRRSFREEGIRWMFRGWTPAFIRLGPNTVSVKC
ncbi:mitochondrial carrier domain-containing protein [Phakopsora pachyrhizi]|nr:mitochondrial carrier domain-containing protein [Phakopsora pachyrhizi]